MRKLVPAFIAAAALISTSIGRSAEPAHEQAHGHEASAATPSAGATHPHRSSVDERQRVTYPAALRIDTLAHMREHLQTLAEIQAALGTGAFEQASSLAEQRLGLSSLGLHGAREVARYMPRGMQAAGETMHRAASRFAVVAQDASATGDLKPVAAAFSTLVGTCVACHAAYRLQ